MVQVCFFETLSSTMDEARIQALEGANEGSVIAAYEQVQARGRRGRAWEAFRGNIHFTYITYSKAPLGQSPQLSFVACVAAGEALQAFLPPTHLLTYKWPNDVLLNGKKIGGLLLETHTIPDKEELCYLIGCGINLVKAPQKVRYPTTSLQDEGIYLPLEETLKYVALSLDHYITLWKKEGFQPIHNLWMLRAANLEKTISIETQGTAQSGIFKGIDMSGAMILSRPDGTTYLSAGEVLWKENNASSC